jgi:hypothetical protein
MSVQQQISLLIQNFSENAILEKLAEQTLMAQHPVKITGAVVGCRDSSLVLNIGEVQLEIPTQKILAIQENPSTPAIPDESVYVDLQVLPSAKIVERRLRMAAEYDSCLGKRPFVYELPSQAADFSISEEEFQAHQFEWLEQVGLAGFQIAQMAQQTAYQTSNDTRSDTRSQTSKNTFSTTSTPRGMRADNKPDFQIDSRPDYRTDWKSDQRFDM